MVELLWFFDRLINLEGCAVFDAVQNDPETIEWLANQPERDGKPSLFGHTREINLLMMAIEVQTGKRLPRPKLPGIELRTKRKIRKLNSSVDRAQERNRRKKAL